MKTVSSCRPLLSLLYLFLVLADPKALIFVFTHVNRREVSVGEAWKVDKLAKQTNKKKLDLLLS